MAEKVGPCGTRMLGEIQADAQHSCWESDEEKLRLVSEDSILFKILSGSAKFFLNSEVFMRDLSLNV